MLSAFRWQYVLQVAELNWVTISYFWLAAWHTGRKCNRSRNHCSEKLKDVVRQ